MGASNAPLPAGSTSFGIDNAIFEFDGVTVLGPDGLKNVSLTGANSQVGSIEWLGGDQYRLTYNISVAAGPFTGMDGVPFSSTLNGVIVANATIVPEPSSLVLSTIALLGLCLAVLRRHFSSQKIIEA